MKWPTGTALIAAAVVSFSAEARAQGLYWTFVYEPSVPIGSIRNAVTNVSLAGGALTARYLFTRQWSLGIGGHWAEFTQNYPKSTYPIENGAITGAVYRRVSVVSALAEGHAYFMPSDPINPYIGLGAGMSWMSNELLISDLSFDDVARGLMVSSEAGVLIAFDRDLLLPEQTAMQSVLVGMRYAYSTAGSRDVGSTSFLGLTVGLFVY